MLGVLGIFGSLDRGIPPRKVRAFEARMNAVKKSVEIKMHNDAGHAFENPAKRLSTGSRCRRLAPHPYVPQSGGGIKVSGLVIATIHFDKRKLPRVTGPPVLPACCASSHRSARTRSSFYLSTMLCR
jgi:hypothetical protein